MRVLASLALLMSGALLASATGTYQPGFGCPSRGCVDRISVSINAPRGEGALFVGIVPVREGQPALPGAFFTGPSALAVSPRPLAIVSGEIGPYRSRFTVPGGVCAIAAANGFTGTVGVFAGYGMAPPELVTMMRDLEKRVADAEPEVRAQVAESMEKLRASGPLAAAATESMLKASTFWPIATLTCGAP